MSIDRAKKHNRTKGRVAVAKPVKDASINWMSALVAGVAQGVADARDPGTGDRLRLGEIRDCMIEQHRSLEPQSGVAANLGREHAISLVDSITRESATSKVRGLVDRVAKMSDPVAAKWMFAHYRDLEILGR